MLCPFCRVYPEIFPFYGKAPHAPIIEGMENPIIDRADFVEEKQGCGCGTYYCNDPLCDNSRKISKERGQQDAAAR